MIQCAGTELTIEVRRGSLLSRRSFSRTPHLLCASEGTDKLIINEKIVQGTGGRGVEELEDYSVKAFGALPAVVALEIFRNHSLTHLGTDRVD